MERYGADGLGKRSVVVVDVKVGRGSGGRVDISAGWSAGRPAISVSD
jgi:hypothetical protein